MFKSLLLLLLVIKCLSFEFKKVDSLLFSLENDAKLNIEDAKLQIEKNGFNREIMDRIFTSFGMKFEKEGVFSYKEISDLSSYKYKDDQNTFEWTYIESEIEISNSTIKGKGFTAFSKIFDSNLWHQKFRIKHDFGEIGFLEFIGVSIIPNLIHDVVETEIEISRGTGIFRNARGWATAFDHLICYPYTEYEIHFL